MNVSLRVHSVTENMRSVKSDEIGDIVKLRGVTAEMDVTLFDTTGTFRDLPEGHAEVVMSLRVVRPEA